MRAQLILGWTMAFWGLAYILGLFVIASFDATPSRGFLPLPGLIGGTLMVIITLYYIIEIIRSGWLTFRRAFFIMLPFLVILAVYATGLLITGETPEKIEEKEVFIASLGHFNIWFRLVFILFSAIYLLVELWFFVSFAPRYKRWVEDHYSTIGRMDLSWISYYLLGLTLMTLVYYWAMFDGSGLPALIHYLVIIPFFSYINFKSIFHESPYPEGFFRKTLDDDEAEEEAFPEPAILAEQVKTPKEMEEQMIRFDTWMRTEKPYLQPTFQRSDAAQYMQINRTYLSRLFNEGFGQNFNHLVRSYRIEEACRLLHEQPRLTAREVSILSGFASEAVFFRAFQQVTGMTPKQYKEAMND